jgi:hypothetical protein
MAEEKKTYCIYIMTENKRGGQKVTFGFCALDRWTIKKRFRKNPLMLYKIRFADCLHHKCKRFKKKTKLLTTPNVLF